MTLGLDRELDLAAERPAAAPARPERGSGWLVAGIVGTSLALAGVVSMIRSTGEEAEPGEVASAQGHALTGRAPPAEVATSPASEEASTPVLAAVPERHRGARRHTPPPPTHRLELPSQSTGSPLPDGGVAPGVSGEVTPVLRQGFDVPAPHFEDPPSPESPTSPIAHDAGGPEVEANESLPGLLPSRAKDHDASGIDEAAATTEPSSASPPESLGAMGSDVAPVGPAAAPSEPDAELVPEVTEPAPPSSAAPPPATPTPVTPAPPSAASPTAPPRPAAPPTAAPPPAPSPPDAPSSAAPPPAPPLPAAPVESPRSSTSADDSLPSV